ncbi:prion-inhibition and propagation-domain-containing protein [Fusarium austroafricanum]|uniref:Prion-inhibition and propagation-domain-containing protein n=1 Tax=Fusarium austroafricanum TaxID=2364996 RepID=A0A8H4KAB7_9HYPO|nr:prion-inhibition and propagation-domain-containing protein [Fusarium austroafricanum]
MAEAFGLAAGILPMFKLCLDYFQFYKTAQASTVDSQILLYKLDCEHESFNIWGEKHGVFEEEDSEKRNPELDHPNRRPKITTALKLIHGLLSDAEALRERYGVGISTTASSSNLTQPYPSNSGLKRLKWLRRRSGDEGMLDIVQKTRWAINDKTKFQDLITHLHDLVDSLYKILPVPPRDVNAVAIRDIRSLTGNMANLEVFEKASQDAYPAWSGAASVMREAASTRAPDAISQWVAELEDESGIDGELNRSVMDKPKTGKDFESAMAPAFTQPHYFYGSAFFVFTQDCPSSSSLSCGLERLEIHRHGPSFVFENDKERVWGLGNRITEAINPSIDIEKINGFANASYEVQESVGKVMTDLIKGMYPAARVYIYCPPCRCAIRSALIICQGQNKDIILYRTRVDERIPCSCCPSKEKLDRLRSIHKTTYEWDIGLIGDEPFKTSIRYIDRSWLEKRIYALETELYDKDNLRDDRGQISDLLGSLFPREWTEKHLFFAEASHCSWILQTKPFPWSPRFKTVYLGTFTSPPMTTSKRYLAPPGSETAFGNSLKIPSRAGSILSRDSGFSPKEPPAETTGLLRKSYSSASYQASDETGMSSDEESRSSKRIKM